MHLVSLGIFQVNFTLEDEEILKTWCDFLGSRIQCRPFYFENLVGFGLIPWENKKTDHFLQSSQTRNF